MLVVVCICSNAALDKRKRVLQLLTEKKNYRTGNAGIKAQEYPHFIFNCLTSSKDLVRIKIINRQTVPGRLLNYLRITIDNSDASIISVKDEMHYLDNYLALENTL